jgi:DNA-binding IclR family transcriptional regulator
VSEWWESASRARVVMLLAMNHRQSLSLTDIIEKAGASEENVLKVLKELQEEGVVGCHGQPAMYAIADEPAFLRHMHRSCADTRNALGQPLLPGHSEHSQGWAERFDIETGISRLIDSW